METRYPDAKHDVSGKMKVRGRYAAGFPRGAVVHFTAGGPNAENTVAGGIRDRYLYFVIGPDGQVYQNFELTDWGYHAGPSSYPKLGSGVSQYLVGIELCNAGRLRQIDENRFRPWFNDPEYYKRHKEPVPAGVPNLARDFTLDQVRYVARKDNCEAGWYHCYTDKQEAALIKLLLWLKAQKPEVFQFEFVVGHDEVSPGRKNDPGGALSMTMPQFRAHLEALYAGEGMPPAPVPVPVPAEEPLVDSNRPEDDSTPDEGSTWTAPGQMQVHFGRFLPNDLFSTTDGNFFLSARDPDEDSDPKAKPFIAAREREGQYAVVRGSKVDGCLVGCTIEEALPPIASSLFQRLLEMHSGVREQVLGLARLVRKELLDEVPPIPAADPLRVVASGPRPLCVLDVGHRPGDRGAEGTLAGKVETEYDFNSELARLIEAEVKNAEIVITSREDTVDGYKQLPARINRYNPAFVVSLHANSNGSTASGSEVIYFHASKEGRRLAELLQKEFVATLGLNNRGTKGRRADDRGGSLLVHTRAPIVIGEPFFISNPSDLGVATARKAQLAAAYAAAIDDYAATLSHPETTDESRRLVESHVEPGTSFELQVDGLTKQQFFARNRNALEQIIAGVNARLEAKYSDDYRPLTLCDAWVLTYCEAGLDAKGHVDPDHRHSVGERGMLPLPENVRFWNGPDAPAWNKPMPLARNIEHFYLYLGNLKNKAVTTVGGRTLYRDLFLEPGIKDNPEREAKLLAGVVHGYFYSATYDNRSVPYQKLIDGYRNDIGLADLMRGTAYVHAGTSILSGREKNVKAGLELLVS